MAEKLCNLRKYGGGTPQYLPTATLLHHVNSGTSQTYTFSDNYDMAYILVSGGGNSRLNYNGTGSEIATDDTGGAATHNYTSIVSNVKSGDTINTGSGTAVLVVYGVNLT